jgi:hypothetical protein
MTDETLKRLEAIATEPYIGANNEILPGLYGDIHIERIRAHKKHIANGHSMENLTAFNHAWLPVVVEEVGEVARALNDAEGLPHLREELVQCGAMIAAWIDSCDRLAAGRF